MVLAGERGGSPLYFPRLGGDQVSVGPYAGATSRNETEAGHRPWREVPRAVVYEVLVRLIAYVVDPPLAADSIQAVFHYVPLHASAMGQRFGRLDLPVTDYVSDRLVRLPLYAGLHPDDLGRVVDAVLRFKS